MPADLTDNINIMTNSCTGYSIVVVIISCDGVVIDGSCLCSLFADIADLRVG